VFRSKRGDRLKILVWDGTGLVLVYKVLEQGSFAWVKTGPEGINPSSGRIEGTRARNAGGAGRDDAVVTGAVRGVVRTGEEDKKPVRGTVFPTQVAARDGAACRSSHCGRVTHLVVFGVVLLGFSAEIG